MNYIKIFPSAHDLSVYVGNFYSEDQLMHTFLDNFHQGGRYYAQIDSHEAKLSREAIIMVQKSSYISSLQTDYLNLDSSLCFGKNVKVQKLFIQSAPFVYVLITLHKNASKSSDRKRKCFVRLVIWTTDERNVRLGNVSDVDLNMT